MDDQNWNTTYISQKTFINQSIFFEQQNNNNLNIFFDCVNNVQNNNYSFCGIENLFVVSLTCQNQQQLNLYKYYNNQNPCISYCGDGLISSNEEECDDGNLEPFDGCFNCRFSCNEQCVICIKGSCLECKYGYYLNEINNICETQCGDSIIEGFEQCDDGNQDNYDGCSSCLSIDYQKCEQEEHKQLNKCSFCYFGRCLQCADGYILDDGICVSFCGDGIVNKLDEECDNPNDIGCIDCRIQKDYVCIQLALSICKTCGDYCTSCKTFKSFDVICESCQAGYYPVNDQCQKCDSNCLTCLNQSFLCTSCFREDCQNCEIVDGLYADQKSKKCISKCGDGIAVQYFEQCDDGNIKNGDGCNQFCEFEFTDSEFQDLSQWSLTKQNTYDLKLMNTSNYNLSLLCNTSEISIHNFTINEFNYNQTKIDGMCKIEFEFLKNIYTYNTIQITIRIDIANTRLLTENNKPNVVYKISPKEQLILSDQQKQQTESFNVIQQSFSLIFIILIPISIVTNLFDYLWSVLEILSWINNFYFINVKYPFNVEIVFLNSDWSSLINFPTYQGFNQPDCDYYFKAPIRFQNKGIDPLFINNAQVPFMFILTSIALYIVNYILLLFFNYLNVLLSKQYKFNQKHFSIFNLQAIKEKKQISISNQQENQVKIENNKILQIIVNLLSKSSNQFKNKIKQTISLCLLDITLACMLQFTFSKPEQHFIVAINQLLACLSVLLIIFQLNQSYSLLRIHKLLAENKIFKEKYEIYYENINTDDCFGYYYNLIGLLKKIFYIFFMVFFYYIPILQALFCFISTSIGFALICYKNPYTTKSQYVLQLILDLNLSLINLILVIFSFYDYSNYQYIKDNIDTLGWIIISLIIFSIFLEICSLLYGLLKYFYQIVLILKSYYQKTDLNNGITINQSLSIQEQKQIIQQDQFIENKKQ
ncbi:unnamed protein product [Paramecium sonneborni]|uniref:Transmembrane protein n=1 Tax=Paramecium sonneborni TaxID=65129 RepID=A0A8S1RN65_9CILI|nr:unnamed protein product [Paramecium sonneborni]